MKAGWLGIALMLTAAATAAGDTKSVAVADNGQTFNPLAARGVALADFNGDGKLDAFFANEATADGDGDRLYFGDGKGGVKDSGQVLPDSHGAIAAAGDVNGDGRPDVVTTTAVLLNWGRLAVHAELLDTSKCPRFDAVALGDLNRDGRPDVVAVCEWKSLHVLINDGRGRFRDSGQALDFGPAAGSAIMGSIALGDLDGDGRIEVVTGGWRNTKDDACPNRVWRNDGKGVLSDSGVCFDFGRDHIHGVTLADLTGSGRLDIVFAATRPGRAGRILFNDGHGVFRDSGQFVGHSWTHSIAVGDIDGDGTPDLFLACGDPVPGTPNEVWLNDGHGVFRDSGLKLGNAFSVQAALGDLDGDSKLDAVVANLRVADDKKMPPVFGGQPAEVWLNTTGR